VANSQTLKLSSSFLLTFVSGILYSTTRLAYSLILSLANPSYLSHLIFMALDLQISYHHWCPSCTLRDFDVSRIPRVFHFSLLADIQEIHDDCRSENSFYVITINVHGVRSSLKPYHFDPMTSDAFTVQLPSIYKFPSGLSSNGFYSSNGAST
jgi:hypothetical protein